MGSWVVNQEEDIAMRVRSIVFVLVFTVSWLLVSNPPAWSLTGPMKWEQMPEYADGFDLQSQLDSTDCEPAHIIADDWICPDGRPIIDIAWWGSYRNNEKFQPDGFHLVIYNSDPWDQPCEAIRHMLVGFSEVNETDTGKTDAMGQKVYKYTFHIPSGQWVTQELGIKYWLCIVADTPNIGLTPIWGWHTGRHWPVSGFIDAMANEDGVCADFPDVDPQSWISTACNMAFSLTMLPGPGDVDGNGVVDGLDITAVLAAWYTVPGDPMWDPRADLDDNGIINGLDLAEVISNWTTDAAPEAAASDSDAKPDRGKGNAGRGAGNVKRQK
jgi:hypothetical protein